MAGGEGSRLWPASTPETPKPFLDLVGGECLFRRTLERFAHGPAGLYAPPVAICATATVGLVRDQAAAAGIALGAVVAEPVGRGTAVCAAVAALKASETDPDALVLLAPSDHRVGAADEFHRAVVEAAVAAAQGRLVVFGAAPTSPAIGYGYLRPGEPLAAGRMLDGFVEKPDEALAAELVADGWRWNAGLFLGSAATFLSELAEHAPEHLEAARAATRAAVRSDGAFRLGVDALKGLEPISFDRGVMEKTRVGVVVPFDCGWTDLGTWDSVWAAAPKDAAGNVAHGDVSVDGATGCLVHAQGLPVRVVGLSDLIVTATPSGVLVRPRR